MELIDAKKLIVIAALLFSLSMVLADANMPTFSDSVAYADLAKNIYMGRGFQYNFEPDVETNNPALPYSLAFFMALFGMESMLYMKAFLVFFSMLVVFFLFMLFREISGKEWAALVSTVLLITVPEFIFNNLSVLSDIPALAVMSACAWVFIKALRSGDSRLWALSGALLGLSVLFRNSAVILGAVFLLYSIKKIRKGKLEWKHLIVFICVSMLVFSPWIIREVSRGAYPGQNYMTPRGEELHLENNILRIIGSAAWYAPVISIVFIYMLYMYYKGRRKHNELLMLIWFFLFLGLNIFLTYHFSPRYMFTFLVPMCYFFGMFAEENWKRRRSLVIALIAIQLILASFVLYVDWHSGTARGSSTMAWHLAGNWVTENTPDGETVYDIGSGGYYMAFYADRKVINLGDPLTTEEIEEIKSISPETLVISNVMKRSFDEDLLISELGYEKCFEAEDKYFVRVYRPEC